MKLKDLELYPLNRERIQKLVAERGYTTAKVEEIAYCEHNPRCLDPGPIAAKTVERWIDGTTKKARGSKIKVVAKVLGADPRELITYPEGAPKVWAPAKKFIRCCDVGVERIQDKISFYFECNFGSHPIQHGDRTFIINAKKVWVQIRKTDDLVADGYEQGYASSRNLSVQWTGTHKTPCQWELFPEDGSAFKGHVKAGNLCSFSGELLDNLVAVVLSQPGYLELLEHRNDEWVCHAHISVLSDVLGHRGDAFGIFNDDLVLHSTRLDLQETKDDQQSSSKDRSRDGVTESQM